MPQMIERQTQPKSSFDSLVPHSISSSPFSRLDKTDMRIVKAVLEKLAQETPSRGLGGVAERLGDDVLNEWITSQRERRLASTAVTELCTQDELNALKDAAGLEDVPELHERLARILPHIIQYLAPLGEIPSNRLLTYNIRSLLRQLG
jgi:uncharacterized protein YidB (DUF937 family)